MSDMLAGQLQFVLVVETLQALADFAQPFLAVSSDIQVRRQG